MDWSYDPYSKFIIYIPIFSQIFDVMMGTRHLILMIKDSSLWFVYVLDPI